MKKFFKELGEQYDYTWWWLLEQGIIFSTFIVNTFFLAVFTVFLTIFYFIMKWVSRN